MRKSLSIRCNAQSWLHKTRNRVILPNVDTSTTWWSAHTTINCLEDTTYFSFSSASVCRFVLLCFVTGDSLRKFSIVNVVLVIYALKIYCTFLPPLLLQHVQMESATISGQQVWRWGTSHWSYCHRAVVLNLSTPVNFIPKNIGLGTPPLRKLQRRYMMKGWTSLWWGGLAVYYYNSHVFKKLS